MQESLISSNQKGAKLTIELTQSSTDRTTIKFHRIQIILELVVLMFSYLILNLNLDSKDLQLI